MSFKEFSGKSVKEAIAKACEELNVEEALLDVEVLEESTRGFLGIVGQRNARIRVTKRNPVQEVMEVEAPRAQPSRRGPARGTVRPSTPPPEPAPLESEGEEEHGFDREEAETPSTPPPDLAPYLDQAKQVLEEILRLIPVPAEVDASLREGSVNLDIKGDGSGLLIGKKGQTLDALQFLVNKIVNRENPPGKKVDVVVDTESYRFRKIEIMREMALKVSQKARRTLKPVSLSPMSPQERRLIHLILAEDREVYTKSYGEGALRRIIVYPRKGMTNKRRRG